MPRKDDSPDRVRRSIAIGIAIGEAVKKKRMKLGMSQDELAIELRIAQGTISRMERGELIPQFDLAYHVGVRLGLNFWSIVRRVV